MPAPAYPDPRPNGDRDGAISQRGVFATLLYVGTCNTCPANPGGVDYNSDKGIDTDGDTAADIPPDGVPDGQDYDRSPGADPSPPWNAGSSDGSIYVTDVLAVLAQVGLACSGPP